MVISGFDTDAELGAAELAELAQHLKQQLGCGGSVETQDGERVLLLQGDQPARVAELLRSRGFRVNGVPS